MTPTPSQFDNVSVICKANVFFEGRVVSHTVMHKDGRKVTLGLIYPGTFKFNTGVPEKMEITAGACRVRIAGQGNWQTVEAGGAFNVPGKSSFEIAVDELTEYICSFE